MELDETRQDGWDKIKQDGSDHYKSRVEPIDLMRDLVPHSSLTALAIKALTDNIKYSYRMLTRGANGSDCGKIIHYTRMVRWLADGQDQK